MARISNWHLPDEGLRSLCHISRDDNVTDINYNGRDIWVDDVTRGRYLADLTIDKEFEKQFVMRIKNAVSANFNRRIIFWKRRRKISESRHPRKRCSYGNRNLNQEDTTHSETDR